MLAILFLYYFATLLSFFNFDTSSSSKLLLDPVIDAASSLRPLYSDFKLDSRGEISYINYLRIGSSASFYFSKLSATFFRTVCNLENYRVPLFNASFMEWYARSRSPVVDRIDHKI